MKKQSNQKPAVGIAVIILHNNKVLLGRRLKRPMLNSWQLPGGWLHYAEQPEQAVSRKIREFSGMVCNEAQFITYTNNQFSDGLHSISLYFQLDCLNAEVVDLSLNQHCSDWSWVDWYDLPKPLFLPLLLLKQSGYEPFIRAK